MKKTILIFFSLIISSHLVLAQINVSGTVLLENQTNHDSISIIFEMTAPNSSIDTTYTDISGNFNFSLPGSGVYNITYSKVGYFSEWLKNQTLVSNTNLAQDTLLKHTTIINIPLDFATIQSGIDHAYVNDTVLIESGTYTENVVINNKSVVIGSYYLTTDDTSYIGTTVIDGNNSGSPIWITGTSSVIKLIGLTIKGGAPNDQNTMGGGISISSADSVLIRKVNIYGSSGVWGGGISAGNTGYFYINSSIVHNNSGSNGGGIMLWNGGDKAEIVNTIIANNTVQGDGGGVMTEIDTTIILNTIIVNNQQPPGRYGPGLCLNMIINDSVLVMNSIITGNTREGESHSHQIFVHGGQLKSYNSILGANWASQPHTAVNNLIYPNGIDPFINSSGGDYHLTDYSSAIGSGINSVHFSGLTITAPSTDYYGASRPTPAGSNPDIGAIENNRSVRKNIVFSVKQNGNGDYTTIQSAIDNILLLDGDTVLVDPGTYVENINFNGKNITLASNFIYSNDTADISNTIIDGGGYSAYRESVVRFINGESSLTQLIGFTIQNGNLENKAGLRGAGIRIINANPKISHCIVNNNIADDLGGGISLWESNSEISNCKFTNNISEDGGGGISVVLSLHSRINNCIISNNNCTKGFGSGIYVDNCDTIEIVNSVINNNYGGQSNLVDSIGIYIANSNSFLINNTIASQAIGLYLHLLTDTKYAEILNTIFKNRNDVFFSEIYDLSYINFYNTILDTSSIVFYDQGQIVDNLIDVIVSYSEILNCDPQFVDEEFGNYKLKNNSPAIGRGLSISPLPYLILPTYDLLNNPRPNPIGSNPDIGAYENNLAYPSYYYTNNDTICDGDSLLWHSNYYLQSGIYYDSLQTVNDCDSIYELSLSVMQNPYPFTILGEDTVILDQTEGYTVPDSSNLTYNWNVQNSTIIDSLSNHEYSIQWNNLGIGYIYVVATNQHGCTSDTAKLEVYVGSTDVRDIVNNKNIKIYPNPAHKNLIVSCNEDFLMEIYDLSGRKLIVSEKKETDISDLSEGMYIVLIKDRKGLIKKLEKLVVE
jgi:hypothetical protein